MASSVGSEGLVRGLKGLRNGALLSAVASALSIASIAVAQRVEWMTVAHVSPGDEGLVYKVYYVAFVNAKLLIVAGLLYLASVVLEFAALAVWFMAAGRLKAHSARLGVGRLGVALQILALAALVVGIEVATLSIAPKTITSLGMVPMAVMAVAVWVERAFSIPWLIGAVLFGLMLRRLSGEGVDGGFKVAGPVYMATEALSITPCYLEQATLTLMAGTLSLFESALICYCASVGLKKLRRSTSQQL